MNPPNRPTGPRIKVNQPPPAVARPKAPLDPAFAKPAPAPAPAPARPTAARPNTARAPRPVVKSGAGFFTKAFIWLLLLAIGALVGGGYYFKGEDGQPLAKIFIHRARVLLKMEPAKPPAPPAPKLADDPKFKEIVAAREGARAVLEGATNPAGDLVPSVAAEIEKRIDGLARNTEELATLSAKFPGTGAEIAAHAKLQKEMASALATIQVALEKVNVAKAAAAAKAAQPVVVEVDLSKLNPWAGQAAGAWVRWKKTSGKTVVYEDEVLQATGDAGSVVAVTGFAGETPYRLPDRSFSGGKGKALREESVKVGDADVPCTVVEIRGLPYCVAKGGRWGDRLVVKDGNASISAIGEEDAPVKGETKKCAKFERNGLAFFGHEDVPGFLVRVVGDGIVSEVVDFGTGAKPEFPQPARPPEAEADVAAAFKRANPWSGAKQGMWTRRKAEYVSPLASSETALDAIVLDVAEDGVTLKLETLGLDGQVRVVEQKSPWALPGWKVAGEETLKIGPTDYPCVILETSQEKAWVSKGPIPAVLKAESMNSSRLATAVEETSLRVGRHEVKCLRVTSEGKRDDNFLKEEVWLSAEVPGGEARRETVQQTAVGAARSTTTLLDFGDIPARKTAIGFQKEDPARLEELRMLKAIDDAEEIVIGASTGFRELVTISKELPSDPARLRELLLRCDEVAAQLTKAKETYGGVRDRAPAAAGVDEKMAKIDRALAALQKIKESIRAKLK